MADQEGRTLKEILGQRHGLLVAVGILAILGGGVLPLFLLSSESPPTSRAPHAESIPLPTPAPGEPPRPELTQMLTRLAVGAVFVLLLSVVTLWVVGRWIKPWQTSSPSGQLAVLETVPLDQRCLVYLVRARGQRFLAAVDRGGLKAVVAVPPTPSHADDLRALFPGKPDPDRQTG